MHERHYLHGDYLQPEHVNPTSQVYCGICDGYCLPEHLYDEHDLDESMRRLTATRKNFYRAKRDVARPENAPNFFDGNAATPG